MRLNRLFLYFAVEQLVAAGFNHYIGLAKGIPTQGYLDDRLPETSLPIYINPTTAPELMMGGIFEKPVA